MDSNINELNLKRDNVVCSNRRATVKELLLVHSSKYIDEVRDHDPNNERRNETYDLALTDVGRVLTAVDNIEKKKRQFCFVHSPGQHASKSSKKGTSIFNNVAIAARYSNKKCVIINWDCSAADGTESIFRYDKNVLLLSCHSLGWPITPSMRKRWKGGSKYNKYMRIMNDSYGTEPNPEKMRREELDEYMKRSRVGFDAPYNMYGYPDDNSDMFSYVEYFECLVKSIVLPFEPELIFICCGFVPHKDDPLSNLGLTVDDYRRMTEIVVSNFDVPIISVLEGGYTAETLNAHLSVLD